MNDDPMEREAKIRLKDPVKLRSTLESASAEFDGRVLERNWLFDHAERSLARKDKLLRLREAEKVYLTFKGPRQQSELKVREELQLEFPDTASARALLDAVGFNQWFYYEKIRETWRLGRCEIVLDELPQLGLFVEIEGPNDEEIEAVRKRLKLPREYINVSYVELLSSLSPGSRDSLMHFSFPSDYDSILRVSD